MNVLETALKAAALPREKFIVLQCIDGVVWLIDFTLLVFILIAWFTEKKKQSRRQINRITTKIESRITFKVFLITVAVALLFNAQLKRKSHTNGNCCCPCLFNFRRFTGLPTKYEMVFPPRIEQLSLVVV